MPQMKLNLVTGGALAALAAALAFTAAPASARPNDDRRVSHSNNGQPQRSAHSAQHSQRWSGQPNRAQAQRSPQAQVAQPQRAQPSQARQQPQQQRNWNRQAQPQRQNNNWARQAEARQQSRVPQAQRPQNRAAQRHDRNRTYADPRRNTTYRNDNRGNDHRGNDHRGNDRDWRAGNGNHRQWDRNWRGNNRYDWQRYRSANRNLYHVGHYYAPYRNYSYRRLSVGFYLDSLFFGSNYWINDPYQYRLPEVYGPYRWVRYYDDALLVDVYSGEVVDVIYDFFW
jgi:hypothetical protein